MIRLTFLLALASFFSLQGVAQHSHDRGVCGTNEIDIERTKANIAFAKANPLQSRSTTYVPIRFHLIGETDGTNAVSPNKVLDLMNALNVDFAPYDLQFFLEDGDGEVWDYTFRDELFNDHADFQPFLRNVRRNTDNAITIFVPNTATPPNSNGLGVTLGYYSPTNDYLVFKKSEVSGDASTASHEVGHYFSLPHTFRGWDCTSWDGTMNEYTSSPVTITSANFCSANGIPVELVSRGSDGNCAIAADLFCDTPADYNLGFGWDNCTYTGDVQDATGTPLDPDESNFMGYFLDCTPYSFSPEQVGAMNADLASNDRSFLRGQTPSITDAVTDPAEVILPEEDATTQSRVVIDWRPVENAKYYYVEVSDRRSMRADDLFYSEIVTDSRAVIEGLSLSTTYYYRVRAFNQTSFGDYGDTRSFTVGSASSISEQPQAVTSMKLFPNPTTAGGASTLQLASEISGEVTIVIRDLTGRTFSNSTKNVLVGDNSLDLSALVPSSKGSYTISITNAIGISSQRFEVL